MDQLLPPNGFLPQLGGIRGKQHRGFLPTGETVLFLLAGVDFQKRIEITQLLNEEHWFAKDSILWVNPPEQNDPPMSGRLQINQDVFELLTTGIYQLPKYSFKFPAERLESNLEWDDLVLDKVTQDQINSIGRWLTHSKVIQQADWKLSKKIKPGYRTLFYGSPGTGKTLTAALLGKVG